MTREKRLKKEAMESAHWRGHRFSGPWRKYNPACPVFWRDCVVCGAWVRVELNPLPNSIDIGGSAVALNCPITERS